MRSPSWALVLAVSVLGPGARPAPPARAVAVTFDDLPAISVVEQDIAAKERLTHDLLAAGSGPVSLENSVIVAQVGDTHSEVPPGDERIGRG